MVAQSPALQELDLGRRLILAGTAGPDIPGTIPLTPEALKVATKPANTSDDFLFLFFPATPEGRAAGAASLGRIAQRQAPTDPPVAQPSWVAQLTAAGAFITGREIAYTQLARLYQPTLVANGDSDIMLPSIDSELLAEQLPNAEPALYPDAGHGFLFQRHAVFGRRVLDFLRR